MTPRSDYREKIEALGFDFHGDYWREEAYYRFTPAEIERLEEATREAYRMYCEAANTLSQKSRILWSVCCRYLLRYVNASVSPGTG